MKNEPTDPWTQHSFDKEAVLNFRIGPYSLHLAKQGNDLLVREEHNETEENADKNYFAENLHRRYAFEKPVESLRLQPLSPSRPLIVRPRHPLILAQGSHVRFYVSYPIDLQLKILSPAGETVLERLPTEILSDSWFGDTAEGVLSYALKSSARRDHSALGDRPANRCVCCLHVHNESTLPLKCEKLCLRLQHCRIWRDASGLWTSPVHLRYRGTEQLTAIDYSHHAPEEAKKSELISEAEQSDTRNLLRRTFAFTGLEAIGL